MGVYDWDSTNNNDEIVPAERRKILFTKPFEETMIGKQTLDNEKKVNSSSLSRQSFFGRFSSNSSFHISKTFRVFIKLLHNDSVIEHDFKKSAKGYEVLDFVCNYLNLNESSYFGLRYHEVVNNRHDMVKYRYWIDMEKCLSKQFKTKEIRLNFRVRFYPAEISIIKDEITRYMIFSQVRRDLLHGRLFAPSHILAQLGGLIVQSALGDYKKGKFESGYLSQYKLLLKQSEVLECKIEEEHKKSEGLSPAEAECSFLEIASKLETYGYDPFAVNEEEKGVQIFVGASHKGILQFYDPQNYSLIRWNDIEKVDFHEKLLKITVISHFANDLTHLEKEILNTKKKATLPTVSPNLRKLEKKHNLKENEHGFECPNEKFAKHLWKNILALQNFFTADKAESVKLIFSTPKIPFFQRGSTFRMPVKKTLNELRNEKPSNVSKCISFTRAILEKQKPREQNDYVTRILKKYTENPQLLNKRLLFCSSKNCDKCNDRRIIQRKKMLQKEEDDRIKAKAAELEAEENAVTAQMFYEGYYDDDDDLVTHVSSSVVDVNEKIDNITKKIDKNLARNITLKGTEHEIMKDKLIAALNSEGKKSTEAVNKITYKICLRKIEQLKFGFNTTKENLGDSLGEERMIEELHVDETISKLNKKLIKNKSSLPSNKVKEIVNFNTNIMDKKIDVKGTKTEPILEKYPEKINDKKVSSINNKGFLFKQTLKAFMSFILIIIMLFMIIITLFETTANKNSLLKSISFIEFFENDYYRPVRNTVLDTYNKIIRLH
uniref:FERM domain-containing protein n=1 Tax=Strongyloides venezuelensis TaxID=75913 RepID=A0A0K0F7I5_STRVS